MRYERLPFATDAGLGSRARIGLLVLRTDQTVEHELRQVLVRAKGVAVYAARLWNEFAITPETLAAMAPRIPDAARLLPTEWKLRAIGFACTSGAMLIGEGEVARLVRSVHPDAAVTDPVTAAVAALGALGVRRPALLTPYGQEVNEAIAEGFRQRGVGVPVMGSFEEADDAVVARISAQTITEAATRVGGPLDVDGVFVSCTSLRTLDVVARIEAAIGKPVTSSNHALIWHMLRLAGIEDDIADFGLLFRRGAR
jgi:maleate isomerase